ncbi:unnamed protein product [Peronospora destructor]|uniref:Uncharacterized protein n=1 Tax=Peronospora destructor TaxID=86335 RepID=A0AAV0T6H8_9STRA|nr:unnamed protein product [Peronospora destructor]
MDCRLWICNFRDYAQKVISSDAKVIKIWNRRNGAVFTNVETPAETRLLKSFEEEAGRPPSMTTTATQGLQYGFFMDVRLYNKVKAVSDPFAYDDWRKKKLKEKVEAKQSNRITIQRRRPSQSRYGGAHSTERYQAKENSKEVDGEKVDADKRFQIRWATNVSRAELRPQTSNAKQKEDMDSDAATGDDEGEDDEEVGRFARVDDEEDEAEGRPSDESSGEEEETEIRERASQQASPKGKRKPAPKFYEIAEGEKMGDLMSFRFNK